MDQKRAVLFLPDDDSYEDSVPPLMLEAVLFCPILSWVSKKLLADGVQRFFAVCGPKYAQEVRACFPDDADVTISEQHQELLDFVEGPGSVLVIPCPVIPVEGVGEGYVYAAEGSVLKEAWGTGATNSVRDAEGVKGWLTLYHTGNIQEIELMLRDRVVQEHIRNGVRFLDPSAVYVDPRVEIGAGTLILPGTILRGAAKIGRGCIIGPNAMIRDCVVGDNTEINASQVNESSIGSRTHVGPFAYIRPHCVIGDDIKVGDFVEVKNSTLGDGTKISHLTYVGDSDVGRRVNFGCGTVTTNYDGFHKYRCVIGDDAFIGCNTNLIAPVTVGSGAYTAAGSTVTDDVPEDALAVARAKQKNLEGWAARNRKIKQEQKNAQ